MRQVALIKLHIKDTDQLVFQRRDNNPEILSPNMLGFFGGHLDSPVEDPHQAAVRELSEETSLDVNKLDIVHLASMDLPLAIHLDGIPTKLHLFTAIIDNINFQVFEGIGSEVYSKETALERTDLAPLIRYILELHLENY